MKRVKRILFHWFTPQHTNNHRAAVLHSRSFIFHIVLVLLIYAAYFVQARSNPAVLGYGKDISVEKLLVLVNEKRTQNGAGSVGISPKLTDAAMHKASDMFTSNYWAHVSPSGKTPWVFIKDAGYEYVYAGENLAKSFDTSQDVVEAWMRSPSHRENLLKKEYTDIGFAVVNGTLLGEQTTLVVQEFGSSAEAVVPAVASDTRKAVEVAPVIESSAKADLPNINQNTPAFSNNLISSPKKISVLLLEGLLVVLLIDGIYMWRRSVHRLSSNTIAHIIFFLAILGAMGATGIGSIL